MTLSVLFFLHLPQKWYIDGLLNISMICQTRAWCHLLVHYRRGWRGVQRPGIIETINSGHTGTVTLVSERHIATLLHPHNVQSAPRVPSNEVRGFCVWQSVSFYILSLVVLWRQLLLFIPKNIILLWWKLLVLYLKHGPHPTNNVDCWWCILKMVSWVPWHLVEWWSQRSLVGREIVRRSPWGKFLLILGLLATQSQPADISNYSKLFQSAVVRN